jgi:hypothetical protein
MKVPFFLIANARVARRQAKLPRTGAALMAAESPAPGRDRPLYLTVLEVIPPDPTRGLRRS